MTVNNLTQFKGQALFLDGLPEISTKVAECLVSFRGKYLGIYGLKKIDEEIMVVLVTWRGEKISLREDSLTVKAREIMKTQEYSWEIIGDVWATF